MGLGDFRFAGMRQSKAYGNALDSYNNKFVFRILGLRPTGQESKESFCVRRNHAVRQAKIEAKLDIRRRWMYKICTWIEHLRRHDDSIAHTCLMAQGDAWLRDRRRAVGKCGKSRSEHSGETATRSGAGPVHRFASGWLEYMDATLAEGLRNPSKCKNASRTHSEHLHEFIFNGEQSFAIQDACLELENG